MDRRAREHTIIHSFSLISAGIGGGLAPLPGSDAPALKTLQATMILALAELHGVEVTYTAAAEMALTMSACMLGRQLSSVLRPLMPLPMGLAVNAVTAAAITEGVGWGAAAWFRGARP